jgi:antitoxin component YwqK of YwqJK toxin-antitoxin module
MFLTGSFLTRDAQMSNKDPIPSSKGVWQDFYDNRKLQFAIEYDEGKLQGSFKRWDDTGVLILEATFKNDQLQGPFKRWYPSGKLWQEGAYLDGQVHGKLVQFGEDGQKIAETEFVKGKLKT